MMWLGRIWSRLWPRVTMRFEIPPPPPWVTVKKRPPSRRRRQDCLDCGIDTSFATGIGHYYRTADEVWLSVVPDGRGMLCLNCLEARLGRPLLDTDIVLTPLDILHRLQPPATKDGLPYSGWLDEQWLRQCQLDLPFTTDK